MTEVRNAATQAAMTEEDEIVKTRAARFDSANDLLNALEKETRQY